MQLLTITTFFPNASAPQRTPFLKHLVQAMRKRCTLTMVAPMPLAPPLRAVPRWHAQSRVAGHETIDGIDVVHPRFPVQPKLFWLSGLGYALGTGALLRRWHRDHPDGIVQVHCAYPDAVGVALVARLLKMPYVVTAHGSDINLHAKRATLAPQIRWALSGARGVVAVSDALAGKIRALLPHSAPPIVTIPCAGFDPILFVLADRDAARAALGVAGTGKLAVFVGHLVPIKNVGAMIEAWSMLADPSDMLVIVGDGPLRPALEAQAARAGLGERVRFVGMLAQRDVAQWLAAAHLLCLPSLDEGMPNVIVEALASGIPVVASRVGGIPDLVKDNVNGFVVPPGDAPALASALHACLSRTWDPAALRASVTHLTWSALAERNCDFLASLMTSPSARATVASAGKS